MLRARVNRAVPASVRVTLRPIRSNSLISSSISKAETRLLIAGWVRNRCSDAAENEPVSATAINALRFGISRITLHTITNWNSLYENNEFV